MGAGGGGGGGGGGERPKGRPQEQLNCPRCKSSNTKFCYYNNYSLTQPRYFCKSCRRYWTEGGSLRNIPVGGGSRKNRKPSSGSVAAPHHALPATAAFQPHDLNLGFPPTSSGEFRFTCVLNCFNLNLFHFPFSPILIHLFTLKSYTS